MAKKSLREPRTRRRSNPAPMAYLEPKLRTLAPGTAEFERREILLAIMNDPTASAEERDRAAFEALPLCYLEQDPIVVVHHRTGSRRT